MVGMVTEGFTLGYLGSDCWSTGRDDLMIARESGEVFLRMDLLNKARMSTNSICSVMPT